MITFDTPQPLSSEAHPSTLELINPSSPHPIYPSPPMKWKRKSTYYSTSNAPHGSLYFQPWVNKSRRDVLQHGWGWWKPLSGNTCQISCLPPRDTSTKNRKTSEPPNKPSQIIWQLRNLFSHFPALEPILSTSKFSPRAELFHQQNDMLLHNSQTRHELPNGAPWLQQWHHPRWISPISLRIRTPPGAEKLYKHITNHFLQPRLHMLDNGCSSGMKYFIHWAGALHQLVPSGVHHVLTNIRSIQTLKAHLIFGISSCDPNFPLHLWCRLI